MKIINARTNELEEIPLELGEKGRGRKLEKVNVTSHKNAKPKRADEIGYVVFGEKEKHVLLTKPQPEQKGLLVRIDTRGTYTRNSRGSVKLIAGNSERLAAGNYADGIAGNIGSASDELWHVKEPSIFGVTLQGGEHKGYGYSYLFITQSQGARMYKRAELCQLIATDEDPEITSLAFEYKESLHEEVQSALELNQELDQMFEENIESKEVTHYNASMEPLKEVAQDLGFKLPPAHKGELAGVSKVESGVLMPGSKSLVYLSMGPGGGSRYNRTDDDYKGLNPIVDETRGRKRNSRVILATVEDEDWQASWKEYKDGKITAYVLANKDGIHYFRPELPKEELVETKAWQNLEPKTVEENEIRKHFGLELREGQPDPENDETTMEQALREAGLTDNNHRPGGPERGR